MFETHDLNGENAVNTFIVGLTNMNARVVSIELSNEFIMIVYEYLPEVRDPD